MPDVVVPEGSGDEHPAVAEPTSFDQPTVRTVGGMSIPTFGFGTYRLRGDVATTMTVAALERGVRHIDTAQMYQNEAEIGTALQRVGLERDEVFLTTKIDNGNHAPDTLVASLRTSLDQLRTDYVDLLLIHWPVEWDTIGATLSTLAQVQASGMARHIGVSNFTLEQLELAQHLAPIEALQVECHAYFQQPTLLRWCQEREWAFTAYSPLAQGELLDEPTLRQIADDHGVTASAVALAWLVQRRQVNVIPRTSSVAHLEDNLAARTVTLTPDQIDAVDQLDRNRRLISPDFAPWHLEAST